MYLLDTNVISELRKANSKKADKHLTNFIRQLSPPTLFISAVTILELEIGILRLERRDTKQSDILRTWLTDHVLPGFSNRILPLDTAVAKACAKLHVPDPKPQRDAIIAATALTHGLTVLTRNVKDFINTGAKIINPWEKQIVTAD